MAGGAATRRRPSRRAQARRHRVRRWTSALLLGLAAFAVVTAFAPSPPMPPGEPTVVAARDLPAGAVLAEGDLTVSTRPVDFRPRSAFRTVAEVVGQVTAVPVIADDVVTPERLRGPDLLSAQPAGHVAMTLPVSTVEGLGLAPGVRVDVYAAGSGTRVASGAVVLAATGSTTDGFSPSVTPAITLSVPPAAAGAVAAELNGLDSRGMFVLALRRS